MAEKFKWARKEFREYKPTPKAIERRLRKTKIDWKGMEWAGKWVRPQWWQMVETFYGVTEGKQIPYEERVGGVALAPLEVDYAAVSPLMKPFLPTVFLENPTMLTTILNEKGNRIIWLGLETAKEGVYQWVKKLDPEADWVKEYSKLLAEKRDIEAYKFAKKAIKEKEKVELGLIKVARPQFFIELSKTYEASKYGKDWLEWIPAIIEFLRIVFGKEYIRFYPVPYIFGIIPDFLLPMLEEFDAKEIPSLLNEMLGDLEFDMVLTISTEARASAFRLIQKGGATEIQSINQDISNKLYEEDIKQLARNFRDELKPDLVISTTAEPLREIADLLLKAKIPWEREIYYKLGDWLMDALRTLGKNLWIESGEKSWFNLDNLLEWGLELTGFDLKKFWIPSGLLADVIRQILGVDAKIGLFFINKNREVISSMIIGFLNNVLDKVITPPKEKLTEIFKKEEDNSEAVKKACLSLYEDFGWIYPGIVIDIDSIKPLLKQGVEAARDMRKAIPFILSVLKGLGKILNVNIATFPKIDITEFIENDPTIPDFTKRIVCDMVKIK
jgi:hypothetical protein